MSEAAFKPNNGPQNEARIAVDIPIIDGPEGAFFVREATKTPDLARLYQILQNTDTAHEDKAAELVIGAMTQLGMLENSDHMAILELIGYAHTVITESDKWNDEIRVVLYQNTQEYMDTPLIATIEAMYDVTNAHSDIIAEADTLARLLIFQEVSRD